MPLEPLAPDALSSITGLTEADRQNLSTILEKSAAALGLSAAWEPIVRDLSQKIATLAPVAWLRECPPHDRDLYNVDEQAYTTMDPGEAEDAQDEGFRVTPLAGLAPTIEDAQARRWRSVPEPFMDLLEAARRVPSWTGRPVPEGCISDVTFNTAIEAVDAWLDPASAEDDEGLDPA